MASLPTIYTIQASDAPQHSDRLREILQELETENRIKGFKTLGADDDLLSISDTLRKDDMILILLTNELEKKREQVKKRVNTLNSNQPGLRVAEILVDNLIYDNEFITFPDDLHPIRNREDMDEAWRNIGKNLKDMFPVKKKQVSESSAKPFPLWSVYVVLGVFLFGALLIFILPTASGEETEETFTRVPDLAGMSGTEAVSLLLDTGLEAGQRRVESHDTVNRDLVIRSEPNAGESIEKGAQVTLIFSSGREQVRVPELTGVTLDRALAVLEGAGLRAGQQRSEHSDEIERARILRTDPSAGSEIDRGSQINLIISGGRVPIPVPDIRGMSLREARSVLERFELRVGQQQSENSDQIEQGRVIRTDPGVGREVDHGSQINLVISDGRVPISVPDARGMTLDQARAVLEGAGLRVGQHRLEHSDEIERARVIRTDPSAGREVDHGSQINLVTSLGLRVVERHGRFVVRQTWSGDFDRGREVPRNSPRSESDIWFRARTATDRVIVPLNNAQINILRGISNPTFAQVRNALEIGTVSEIDINRLIPGLWMAVLTGEGNYAAFTLEERVGPSPGELHVQYKYWSE